MNPTMNNSSIPKHSLRAILAEIPEPKFIYTLPESFQSGMFKVISDILNLKGNSDTAKYRDLNWHNQCRDTDGKRNRQHMLIQKLKEFYIIYLDYHTVVTQSPELIEHCSLIAPKDFKFQLTLVFSYRSFLNYQELIAGYIGKENAEKLSSKGPIFVNTETLKTYQISSLQTSDLEKAVELGKTWLDKMFPIYSYITNEPVAKQIQSSNAPSPLTTHEPHYDISPSVILKFEDLYLKTKTLIYKKIHPITISNATPTSKAAELTNLSNT
jgi:hypothetical protein